MKRKVNLKRILCYILAVLIFLLGVFVFAYPFANRSLSKLNINQTLESFRYLRSVYNDAEPSPVTDEYGVVTRTEAQKNAENLTLAERNKYDKSMFNELKAAMIDYNQKIYANHQEGLKDAWSYEEAEFDLTKYGVYDNVIAELRIPAMGCDLPLYLGATWNNMAWGAVQLGKTSMPVGGNNTNCVIAGHRGCTNGPYFLYIQNLMIGDKVYIDNLWETLTYKVVDIRIISPDDIPAVLIQEGRDMVTLITCHPYPYNYQRYAVFCERTENDPYVEPGTTIKTWNEKVKLDTDSTDPAGTQLSTEVVEETRVVEEDVTDNSSEQFIKLETFLTYAIPIFILLLAVVLFSLTGKKRLRRRRKNKK